ncbi:transposase, partial [Polyangium fumosum]
MRTGARWADLPERYPPYQTCHRRFQQWSKDGTLERILYAL